MDFENQYPHTELEFNKWLISQYLRYGSVNEVFKANSYGVPISYANYQRILDKWGIIKAAGPNNKLSEVIDFLYRMFTEEVALEKLYKKMPPSFMTSAVTLYRVLGYIKEGITRRMGTALMISPYNDNRKVLAGIDISTPRLELGKSYGSISLPMTFSRKRDLREDAILRVLQYEVFTQLAIENTIPKKLIQVRPRPFMYLDIADVRVEVFKIQLPKNLSQLNCFNSFKLKDYSFLDIDKIDDYSKKIKDFRVGVLESLRGYKKYLELKKRNLSFNPLQYKSDLNYFLAREYYNSEE